MHVFFNNSPLGASPFFSQTPAIARGTHRDDHLGRRLAAAPSDQGGHDLIVTTSWINDETRAEIYMSGDMSLVSPWQELKPDFDPDADAGWATRGIATGDVDGNSLSDVLIAATSAPCASGRAYLLLNYGDGGGTKPSFNAPNAPAITWGNGFGVGKAIVDEYIFISAPGDQQGASTDPKDPADPWLFRAGTVHIYKYVAP